MTGLLVAGSARQSQGQVLEIGSDGAVKTYAGPAVFTDRGVTPIGRVRTPHDHASPGKRRVASRRFDPRYLEHAAEAAQLSPDLVAAVAWRESRGRNDQVSRAGAIGTMQLMPGTAHSLGVDPSDPAQNLKGGATYLDLMMRRYDGDLLRALAAYNAGPGAVDRYKGVPPYKETQAYVASILDRLSQAVVPVAATPAK